MKSMTGYGFAEGRVGAGRIFVEIKTVNHRYCDLLLKIPPKMNRIDPEIRKLMQGGVERGKVEVFLKERKSIVETKDLAVNIPLAIKYKKCVAGLQKALGEKKNSVNLLNIIDIKELVTIADIDVDYSKYWNPIRKVILEAVKKLDQMRIKEGSYLLNDQRERLNDLNHVVEKISGQSVVGLKNYQQRVKKRIEKSIGGKPPKERIENELAALAEKVDIAEELTRLKSHLIQYRQILGQKGSVGRKLDFLIQEMSREVNTLGAKANDVLISKHVVNAKSLLEKLREQVQNIE